MLFMGNWDKFYYMKEIHKEELITNLFCQQDLLLDIRKHSTLDEALDSFFSRERLEDLGYKCEACNKKVWIISV